MRAWILLTLLATTALAGCTGSNDSPQETDDVPDLGLAATKDTGVIRGVVVDQAVRPLDSVLVTVLGADAEPMSMETTADGAFGFQGLTPGSYFVKAERFGYLPAQANVEVAAGVDEPKATRILLESNGLGPAFTEVYKWNGYIECSMAVVVLLLAACNVPNLAPELLCGATGTCLGNLTNDRFLVRHMTDGQVPEFIQSEMVWESTQSLGNSFFAYPGTYSPEAGTFSDKHTFEGPSPIIMPMNGSAFESFSDGDGYQIRVFTAFADEALGRFGLTVQQEFEVITHVFHNFRPEEGWTFVESGSPVPPG